MRGRISISRNNNGIIKIEIADKKSSIVFLKADMDMRDFAAAVTGLSYQDCEFELVQSNNIGKRLEVKQIMVDCPAWGDAFYKEITKIVKPYEIDGWEASEYDLKNCNPHNIVDKKYKVTFRRFIKEREIYDFTDVIETV